MASMFDFFWHCCFGSEQQLEWWKVYCTGDWCVVAPYCLGHYFISFAVFLAFEDFLDCFKNQGVGSLYGAIGLRVLDWGEGYLRPYLMTKVLEHVIVKLLSIVDCDFSWHTKATNVVLLEKLLDCHRAYVGDRLCLNPLGKILDFYNGEGIIAQS
jgi:hypothetical protein